MYTSIPLLEISEEMALRPALVAWSCEERGGRYNYRGEREEKERGKEINR